MAVRAKMRCMLLKDGGSGEDGQIRTVSFYPVHEDNGLNKEWSRWTPSGELTLTITNPAAHRQFELGKVYFVDITPVEEEPAA